MLNKFCGLTYYPYLCIVGNWIEDYGRGIHYLKESEVARPHHSKGSYIIYKAGSLRTPHETICSPPVTEPNHYHNTKIIIMVDINKSPYHTVKNS